MPSGHRLHQIAGEVGKVGVLPTQGVGRPFGTVVNEGRPGRRFVRRSAGQCPHLGGAGCKAIVLVTPCNHCVSHGKLLAYRCYSESGDELKQESNDEHHSAQGKATST